MSNTQDVEIRNVTDLQAGDVIVTPGEDGGAAAVVRRQVPDPLPVGPGYYVPEEPDYGGTVVVELLGSPAGQWVDAGDRTYLTEQQIRDLGPLQPLVRPDELLGAVRYAISTLGSLDGDAKATVYATLDEVGADRYGVQG